MNKTAREVIVEVVRGDGDADSIIASLAAAGFVIVPKEPTEEMESFASEALRYTVPAWSDIYRAMIAAASQDK